MRAFLTAVLVVASALLQAQQPPTVFRSATDLVEVDVVVHDRKGAVVRDLTADDFIIEEAGQPREIVQFYVNSVEAPAAAGAATAAVFDPTVTHSASRVFVVVFDDGHLTASGFKRTQAAAQTFFAQQFRPGDIGGVVTRGRMSNDRLTISRDELLKAVKDAKPDPSKSSRQFEQRSFPRLSEIEAVRIAVNNDKEVLDEAVRRVCADDPDECKLDPESLVRLKATRLADVVRAESSRTLQMLRSLVDRLTRFEGRKTILLMSEGFIAEETWPLVQEVVAGAARANARLYTLDARGLERGLRSIDDAAPGTDDANARLLEQLDAGGDSINSLAVDTGGFVVRNTNQFDKAIARIGDDVNHFYVLAYRPAAAPDGKFHRISVKVKRPGLAVRARRGYVAMPKAATATAIAAPVPATVPLDAGVAAVPPDAPPAAAASEPDPVTATGTIVPHADNTSGGLRVRPDAEAHAARLASARAADADASAGWEAYQRGDVETARDKLTAAAGRGDADAWVHYTLGMASYALGQYRDAATSWERVRESTTDFQPVYFDLVDAYLQLKEHDRAVRTARLGLERWPQDAELYEALGVAQTVRGSLDDALKSFQAAVAIAPKDPTGYFNLAKAHELRYVRSRRYVAMLQRWVTNEADRKSAIEAYERYLALGGPYADAARAGLTRLQWMPTPK